MIEIKLLRKGLGITAQEWTEVVKDAGIGRCRLMLAEHGWATLKPEEERMLRLAIAYTQHCRSVRMAAKLAQGRPLPNSVPMTWAEYLEPHRENSDGDESGCR